MRTYLEEKWGAQVTPGQEADDALGIQQIAGQGNTIIATIDKDLRQIPGKHYNWVNDELFEVDDQQAIAHFYQQILTGDKTDNIISPLYRVGVGTAQDWIAYCESEQEMYELVKDKYDNEELLLKNARLLWIRRTPNELFSFRDRGVESSGSDGLSLGGNSEPEAN